MPANASISSKKTTAGAAALALRNRAWTAFSLSPTHLLSNSGPRTNNRYKETIQPNSHGRSGELAIPAMKFMEHSVAIALANNVLEQPGGPYSNTPFKAPSPKR